MSYVPHPGGGGKEGLEGLVGFLGPSAGPGGEPQVLLLLLEGGLQQLGRVGPSPLLGHELVDGDT